MNLDGVSGLVDRNEFSKEECSEYERLLNAIKERDEEIKYLNGLIKAYSKIEKMASKELMEAEKHVEQITDLSIKELNQRDMSLRNVLKINKEISSILDKKGLLTKILDGLIHSVQAQRGIFFINDKKRGIIPEIFKNIDANEINKDYFRFCRSEIVESAVSQKSIMKLMEELEDEEKSITLSYICLPLVYENNLLGIIYVDIISETKTFRMHDLDIAEIFSSQAVISLNNASLYETIKSQNLELLKLINLKDQFIGDLTKKIDKPLQELYTIVNNLSMQENERSNGINVDLIKSVSIIEKMSTTVNKFLTIQQLESAVNDLFCDNVNFKELFEFILGHHSEEAKAKNVTVEVNLSPHFYNYHANNSIMRTIFDELISNSIYYNKQNGKVNINGYKKGDYLVIDIIDTGNGIKPQDLDRIFEQFYRTDDSPKLNDKGAGLGLFLVKKFIKYYNGEIEVQSVYGEGSTFSVKLLLN